jgi:cephalosporin hydroxylase
MKIVIDTDGRTLTFEGEGGRRQLDLYSREAFELISDQWLQVGWNEKYTYTFSWLGRPIIQLPEDMVRAQEVIFQLRPDVIVEAGVAHGGSLVYYASLCRLAGRGRVIGIDVEIRPHNRRAIEEHPMFPLITLVEGSSIDPAIVEEVRSQIARDEIVLVVLDSNHSRDHVRQELEAYGDMVTPGSYILVQDGIMSQLTDVPRGKPEWSEDSPLPAVADFLARHPEFVALTPPWPFSESQLDRPVTHCPNGWLQKRAGS